MSQATFPSIRTLKPQEQGGPIARAGFEYQDHIAAAFCIEMMTDPTLLEVWCETLDDITLIRQHLEKADVVTGEFVQVKSNEFDQHWSVAKLCGKDSGDNGRSILQKSLEQERCDEEVHFRLVTLLNVHSTLTILTRPVNSPLRVGNAEAIEELCAMLEEYPHIQAAKSPKGNDYRSWVYRAFWDVRESKAAVENDNVRKLGRVVNDRGEILFADQMDELYEKLMAKTRAAATAKVDDDPDIKIIERNDLLVWLDATVRLLRYPATAGAGEDLVGKLNAAAVAQDIIEDALEMREAYRLETLSPKYLSLSETKKANSEVVASLLHLRALLDANLLTDNGEEFHSRCLGALKSLLDSQRLDPKTTLFFLQGCMYDITNRCRHRFVRATV